MNKKSAEKLAGHIAFFALSPLIVIGWLKGYNQSVQGIVVFLAVCFLFIFLAAAGGVSIKSTKEGFHD